MTQAILAALKALDVSNDNHWTADGQPRLDTVKMLAADPSLTRDAVTLAAPGLTRATAAGFAYPDTTAAPAPAADTAVGQGDSTENTATGAGAEATGQGGGDSGATFSDEQAQQPEVADGLGSGPDEVPSLEAQLAEAVAHTEKVRQALDMVNTELAASIKREDALRDEMRKAGPKDTNQDAIKAYLKAQVTKGAERAARQALIKESGLDLKALARDLKSPLDAAMARKTGRGGQRPTPGVKG